MEEHKPHIHGHTYTICHMKWNNEPIMVILSSTILLLSLLPVHYLEALTDKQAEECLLLANHINARVIDTKSQDGIVRLSSGAEVGCEILSFLVYEDGVGVSKEFRPLLTAQEMNECSDKVIAVHDLSREEFALDEFGIVTFNGGILELCQALAPFTIEELTQPQQPQDENGTVISETEITGNATGNMSALQGKDEFNEAELAELTRGQELEPASALDELNITDAKDMTVISNNTSFDELSKKLAANPDEDVTIDDESVRECMAIMDENAEGNPDDYRAEYKVANDFGGSILDGQFNDMDTGIDCLDLLTGKLTPSEARNMLGNASFRVLSGENEHTPESTPNFEDSVVSNEEKSLCSDIMPGNDREIEESGTVTLEDGTTETCDYWIEQQAIGGIFPVTGEGTGEPDKELTERAIEIRAAKGLNASGLPALTYDELIQIFREAIEK